MTDTVNTFNTGNTPDTLNTRGCFGNTVNTKQYIPAFSHFGRILKTYRTVKALSSSILYWVYRYTKE